MEIELIYWEKNKLREQDNYFKNQKRGGAWNTRQ